MRFRRYLEEASIVSIFIRMSWSLRPLTIMRPCQRPFRVPGMYTGPLLTKSKGFLNPSTQKRSLSQSTSQCALATFKSGKYAPNSARAVSWSERSSHQCHFVSGITRAALCALNSCTSSCVGPISVMPS